MGASSESIAEYREAMARSRREPDVRNRKRQARRKTADDWEGVRQERGEEGEGRREEEGDDLHKTRARLFPLRLSVCWL